MYRSSGWNFVNTTKEEGDQLKNFILRDKGRYVQTPNVQNRNRPFNFRQVHYTPNATGPQTKKMLIIADGARNEQMLRGTEIPFAPKDRRFQPRDPKYEGFVFQKPRSAPIAPLTEMMTETATQRALRNNVYSDGFPRSGAMAEKKLDETYEMEARLERLNADYSDMLLMSQRAKDIDEKRAYRAKAEEIKETIDRLKSGTAMNQEELLGKMNANLEQMNLKMIPESAITPEFEAERMARRLKAEPLARGIIAEEEVRAKLGTREQIKQDMLALKGPLVAIEYQPPSTDPEEAKEEKELPFKMVKKQIPIEIPEGVSRLQFVQEMLKKSIADIVSDELASKRMEIARERRKSIEEPDIPESLKEAIDQAVNDGKIDSRGMKEMIENADIDFGDAMGSVMDKLKKLRESANKTFGLKLGDISELSQMLEEEDFDFSEPGFQQIIVGGSELINKNAGFDPFAEIEKAQEEEKRPPKPVSKADIKTLMKAPKIIEGGQPSKVLGSYKYELSNDQSRIIDDIFEELKRKNRTNAEVLTDFISAHLAGSMKTSIEFAQDIIPRMSVKDLDLFKEFIKKGGPISDFNKFIQSVFPNFSFDPVKIEKPRQPTPQPSPKGSKKKPSPKAQSEPEEKKAPEPPSSPQSIETTSSLRALDEIYRTAKVPDKQYTNYGEKVNPNAKENLSTISKKLLSEDIWKNAPSDPEEFKAESKEQFDKFFRVFPKPGSSANFKDEYHRIRMLRVYVEAKQKRPSARALRHIEALTTAQILQEIEEFGRQQGKGIPPKDITFTAFQKKEKPNL